MEWRGGVFSTLLYLTDTEDFILLDCHTSTVILRHFSLSVISNSTDEK